MTRRVAKLIIVAFSLAIPSSWVAPQTLTDQCGPHPGLLRDESGHTVWFSFTQLQGVALKQVMPEPAHIEGMSFKGIVKVKIMVSTGGDVVCIWDMKGHPLMLAAAAKAAHEWKFKPRVQNGKPAEFVGTLELPVSAQ